jgi:hypothetical protein
MTEAIILHTEDFVSDDEALAQIEAIMNPPHNVKHATFQDARNAAQSRANELGYAIAITRVVPSYGAAWFHAGTPQEFREHGRAQETFVYPANA